MKKLYVLLCMLVVASFASAQTSDMALFGFKGEVDGASINSGYTSYDSYNFDEDGNTTGTIYLWDGTENRRYGVRINKRTRNSISGESDYGKFNATVANNHITKIVITGEKNNYPSTYTCTYAYDKKGNLTKVNEVFVYYVEEGVSYGGNVYGVSNYQAELQKIQREYQQKLMSGMTPTQAQNWYNNAVKRLEKAAQGVGVNAYARTKKTKKTVSAEYTYSDYEFDDFGNWITRTLQNGNGERTQKQTINYDPEFWSQFYWERLESEGDLHKIEAFFRHPITTETYKKIASNYWNEHILDEVVQNYGNNLDSLCSVAGKTITSGAVKEQALGIVRERMFNDDVMTERDYSRVAQMKDLKRQDVVVFNDYYRQKIVSRSEKLKADSIVSLTKKAQKEFDDAKYYQSLTTGKTILKIDPKNETAANLCGESSYRLILSKEENNSVKESDYTSFINDYNTSSHLQEMQNKRALYASNLFNVETPDEELKRVLALPTDEKTHKTVNKRYKKWMFKKYRGQFFYIGAGAEFALGPVNSLAAIELSTRYGYTANLLNVSAGLKYNNLTSTSHILDTDKDRIEGNAFFKRKYLSAPVMLRLNYSRDYLESSYIAAGAELNFYTVSAKLQDIEEISDENFANKKLSLSPRIAWGAHIVGMELELFATYDMDNPFDVDYIKNYKLSDGQNIETICDPKAYGKQINGDKFFDKVRGGLALRLMF